MADTQIDDSKKLITLQNLREFLTKLIGDPLNGIPSGILYTKNDIDSLLGSYASKAGSIDQDFSVKTLDATKIRLFAALGNNPKFVNIFSQYIDNTLQLQITDGSDSSHGTIIPLNGTTVVTLGGLNVGNFNDIFTVNNFDPSQKAGQKTITFPGPLTFTTSFLKDCQTIGVFTDLVAEEDTELSIAAGSTTDELIVTNGFQISYKVVYLTDSQTGSDSGFYMAGDTMNHVTILKRISNPFPYQIYYNTRTNVLCYWRGNGFSVINTGSGGGGTIDGEYILAGDEEVDGLFTNN